LKLEDVIQWSAAELQYRKRGNSALDGVLEVTVHILGPDVIKSRRDHLVGIGLFYLAIKSQTLNRCRAAKWLMVVPQPNLRINDYTVYEYIRIISKHHSINFMYAVVFNVCTE